MKCPYCNQEMKVGNMLPLTARASDAIYWLPKHSKIKGIFLSEKKIVESGGLLFGKTDIFSEDISQTYHCDKCKMLFTRLDG